MCQVIVNVAAAVPAVKVALIQAEKDYLEAEDRYQLESQRIGHQVKARRFMLQEIYFLLLDQWSHSGTRWKRPSKKTMPYRVSDIGLVAYLPLPESVLASGLTIRTETHPKGEEYYLTFADPPQVTVFKEICQNKALLEELDLLLTSASEKRIDQVIIPRSLAEKLGLDSTPCLILTET